MAAEKIRWGILATGGIAARFTEDLRLLPDAEVTAVGSRTRRGGPGLRRPVRDRAASRLVAEPGRRPRGRRRLRGDAALGPLRRRGHLPAGRQGGAVREAAHARPRHLGRAGRDGARAAASSSWRRCGCGRNPAIRRVAGLVADGAIGEVTHVAADFGVPGPFPVGHRMRAPELGGGALLDLGVYPVTFAHLFLGRAGHGRAPGRRLTPEGTDQNTGMSSATPRGAVATLHCGFVGETGQRADDHRHAGPHRGAAPVLPARRATRSSAAATRRAGGRADPRQRHGLRGRGGHALPARRGHREPLIPHAATLDVMRTLDEARAQIGVTYPDDAQPGPRRLD